MNNQDIFGPSDCVCLIDGTALFFGQRAVSPEKTMNYHALREIFADIANRLIEPRRTYFFTATDESNEKQVKFHELIRGMGWKVIQTPAQFATVSNPLLGDADSKMIRFDAIIAYTLARLTVAGVSQLILVSDSYPLATPVKDCVRRGANVTVAFFGSLIDSRWHHLFREEPKRPKGIEFLDLDSRIPLLFDRQQRPARRREDDWLSELP